MNSKVNATLQQYGMLPQGACVIIALSGGADSMALAFFLQALREERQLSLQAAHINHHLRGAESDRDEAFVREQCWKLAIPLQVLQADIAAEATRSGEGIEACARRVRYAYWQTLAQANNARIATGHTLSDSIETLLWHIARGTSTAGLCGIPPVRGNIIRPLIQCTRTEVEAYCAENAIPHITDSTNADEAFTRNFLRRQIVPRFYQMNPAFSEAVSRLQQSAREDEAYWQTQIQALLDAAAIPGGYDAGWLDKQPPALLKRTIHRILWEQGAAHPTAKHIEAVRALLAKGGCADVEGPFRAVVAFGRLYFQEKSKRGEREQCELPFALGNVYLFGKEYRINLQDSMQDREKEKVHKKDLKMSFDYDKINGKAKLRNRVPGDAIRLVGRGCTKSLKKLLNEAQIPCEERDRLLVIADDRGILWMEGFGATERAGITGATQRSVVIASVEANTDGEW